MDQIIATHSRLDLLVNKVGMVALAPIERETLAD